ncbi:hypothetical protein ACJMK2_031522 [Sinanodonta woodiana]|uniref:Mitochondria-eating protein n=1 Tax=Sinanodonta woodiana TaxID=1069815 RepID=A0ABD3WZ28_SINWO
MGNLTSWIRDSHVANVRKGPISPRVMSDPELDRASAAVRSSLEYYTSGMSSLQTNAQDAEQQRTINEYKEKIESQQQTIDSLMSDRNSLSDSVEAKPNMEEYEEKLKRMEQTIASLQSEKRDLLDRLSETEAMKQKVGYHNIPYLSDRNRPAKLTEQFSELYDNMWTDSYQLLTSNGKLKDKDAVCTLLHIVQVIYGICLSKSQALNDEFNTALTNFLGQDCSDIKRALRADIDKSVRKRCKDYICESSRVCWNMCIKIPPMYITSETDGLFDKDAYVPYTKAGPCIAYVVWPVVYLHKNGPILKKGVAQGKKKKINGGYM